MSRKLACHDLFTRDRLEIVADRQHSILMDAFLRPSCRILVHLYMHAHTSMKWELKARRSLLIALDVVITMRRVH